MKPAFGRIRSVSVPIAVASVAVVLSVGLIVAWLVVLPDQDELTHPTAILVLGILSPALLLGVFATFSVFLVRRIVEVNRQNRFIDSVTHELKSPLASMKLNVNTLAREGLADDQREMLHRMMRDDIDRLSAFIDDILAATRLVHRQTTHAIDEVDVVALVEACAARVAARTGVGDDAITVSASEPVTLATDQTSLATIVTNLIDNAVKYSAKPNPGDGSLHRPSTATGIPDSAPGRVQVEVCVTAVNERVEIAVSDQGIGIAGPQLRNVFRRFYRAPDDAVRARRGTGLGLYVVDQLTRMLGGRTAATSPGPGRGATFTVTLPMRERRRRRSVIEVIDA